MSEATSHASKLIEAAAAVGTLAKISPPPLANLFVETPLYSVVDVDDEYLASFRARTYQFDAYCIWCERDTTFREISSYVGSAIPEYAIAVGSFSRKPICQRIKAHSYEAHFKLLPHRKLVKIGQFPAIADISGADIKKYRPLLRGGYFEELTRANGLISHGVGIGSFVYLRRIFEKLINDHRTEYETRNGKIEGFDGMRMEDKIAELKAVLPPALVKNRATYGILSSGIHGLNEATCKAYFPVVKAAILQILEQDFEARERQKKEDDLEKEIAKITQTLKSS